MTVSAPAGRRYGQRMRRRIDTYDLRDSTTEPHHYLSVYDGDLVLHDPPLVLRDDALWDALQVARDALRQVEARVLAACTQEPLDAFEVDCGKRLWAMIDKGIDRDEFDRLQSALIDHAKAG
jgi:hypothetical protein